MWDDCQSVRVVWLLDECAVTASAAIRFPARVAKQAVVCFAHVTNPMGNIEGGFEKGEGNGSHDALHVIAQAAQAGMGSWFKS